MGVCVAILLLLDHAIILPLTPPCFCLGCMPAGLSCSRQLFLFIFNIRLFRFFYTFCSDFAGHFGLLFLPDNSHFYSLSSCPRLLRLSEICNCLLVRSIGISLYSMAFYSCPPLSFTFHQLLLSPLLHRTYSLHLL